MTSIIEKPWGYEREFDIGQGYKIKQLYINKGHRTSLQQHEFRGERWLVVAGQVRVEQNNSVYPLMSGETAFIYPGDIHRVCAVAGDAVIVEVQYGQDLRDDDIVRFEDDYGRVE